MIVCTKCGERNEDGTVFCARCGVYLEWEGERVAVPGQRDERAAAAAPGGGGVTGPAEPPTAAATPATTATLPPVPDTATTGSGPPSGTVPERPADGVPPQSPSAGATATARQPDEPAVGARQPTEARRRRHKPPRLPANVPTGSLICGSCGIPNEAGRRFCARCGASLAQARVIRKAPWWRRLLGREHVYEAGERRRSRGRRRLKGALRATVVAALLAGVLALAFPGRDVVLGVYDDVRKMFARPVQVHPASAVATAAVRPHPAGAVIDRKKDTYWAPPPRPEKSGPAPVVRLNLREPLDLTHLLVTGGVSVQNPVYIANPRPERLQVSVVTAGDPVVQEFTLKDKVGAQQVEISADDARRIDVAVLSSLGSSRQAETAILEIEVFGKP